MADANAIPWVPILGFGSLIVTSLVAGFGVLYNALAKAQEKRIESIQNEKEFWKGQAANPTTPEGERRRRIETEENGAPSVAPPPRNRQDSRPLIIAGAEDAAW